ncbi:hypothetical protein O3M35_002435 [Rhynocoris fuscipes]|uniref:Uncharacterized protein n=1 Tax=Rhynocoris fuscipes TaxID=488301 RepID=A0AAW1CPF3_9HEMI
MAIKKSKNKLRRCQKKPKRRSTQPRNTLGIPNDNDENPVRVNDGASSAYKKLGRSGFEDYSKHMARVWWDLPNAVSSGLLMETSKHRIRGGPPHNEDNEYLTQGYPQPSYTVKVLKTAHKIFRIRMKKRYMRKNERTTMEWLRSNNTRSEEPKWANILDKPLFEQYVLLLQYIRSLAAKIAREKGHHEVVCSATPLRVLEQLHPLLHLDFRGSKHYLPKPFIESSDSDTQFKIDHELNKLDRALAKRKLSKDETESTRMATKDEFSSSSTSSTTDEDLKEEEKYRKSSKYYSKYSPAKGGQLLQREGEIFESYRDPDSDKSIFVDFADLGESTPEKVPDLILSNIDELIKQYDIRERKSNVNRRRRSSESEERRTLGIDVQDDGSGKTSVGSNEYTGQSIRNTRRATRFSNIFSRRQEPKPGPSSQTDDLETEENDRDEVHMNSNQTNLNNHTVSDIQANGDTCTLTVSCHGDHIPSKLRSIKRSTQNTTAIGEEDGISEAQIITAGGDACNIIKSRTTTNEVLSNGNFQNLIDSINNLLCNMGKFSETSNRNLDRIEKSIIKIENVIPNVNICKWNDVKRHIRLIIRRHPRISA